MAGTKITVDLENPKLIKLLKLEAQESESKIKDILKQILERHYADKLENRAVAKLAEIHFEEWSDPRDAEYDKK